MTKTLFRSRHNRMITGVCGGLAEYFNIDVSIVRLLFVLFGFTSISIPVYIIASIVIPEQPM